VVGRKNRTRWPVLKSSIKGNISAPHRYVVDLILALQTLGGAGASEKAPHTGVESSSLLKSMKASQDKNLTRHERVRDSRLNLTFEID
jgi:hypothetical protein